MRSLTAIYDLWTSPPTYDFFTFLVEAERWRRDKKYDCIDLAIMPGPVNGFRQDNLPPDVEERRGMLQRVVVAGARLLPSIRNIFIILDRVRFEERDIFPPDWRNLAPVSCYGACFQINGLQCLRATDGARTEIASRFKQPYATITLREAAYWPDRNSNKEAWDEAARVLLGRGIVPVVVPDTHGTGLQSGLTFDTAAWDIDLRLALYEGAVLNLGVATGPMSLNLLAEKRPPYIMLNILSDDGAPAHKEEFLASHGLKMGDHFSANGWTIWEKDSAENIIRQLEAWFAKAATA